MDEILITFTPTMGYTETVRMFQDGADVMRSLPAYLLPDDEGDALPWMALGFESEAEWRRAQVLGPASKPEDIHAWIEGNPHGMPEVPEGRRFKTVPRVLRCAATMEGRKERYDAAVVFFHSTDNPYGNPEVVYRNCLGKDAGFIKERFYGLAEKSVSTAFPDSAKRFMCWTLKRSRRKEPTTACATPPAGETSYFSGCVW